MILLLLLLLVFLPAISFADSRLSPPDFPLLEAVKKGDVQKVKSILKETPSTFSKGDALIYAVLSKKTEVVRVLLKHGARLNEKYNEGKTALMMAVESFNKTNISSIEAITKAFEEIRQRVRPNDLFIFYNAYHGMVDVVNGEEQYFLLTSNVRLLSSQHISEDALSHKDLVSLIGSIPAQKKLVILDTCNAGKGGKEIQIALLQQDERPHRRNSGQAPAAGCRLISLFRFC